MIDKETQDKLDKFYLNLATEVAKFSFCKRKQVGSVLVKDNIILTGHNQKPKGMLSNCEDETGETEWSVLHAESDVLSKILTSNISSEGATIYNTFSPCIHCAKLMIQAKIKRFVYIKTHSDVRGLELMHQLGIIIENINHL